MEKNEILQILSGSICEIVFQKVTNRHFRVMYGTTNPEFIPRMEHSRLENIESHIQFLSKISRKPNIENLVVVWDFINHSWRSFYADTVLFIDTNKERTMIKQYDGKQRRMKLGTEDEEEK